MALHFGHRSRRSDALATTSYVAFVLALAMGCGDDDGDSIDSGAPEDAAVVLDAATEDAGETALDAGADAGSPAVCEPHELTCVDQHIAGLGLLEDPNTSTITNEALGDGLFRTTMDTRAGGLNPTMSYVYVRFTDEGAVQLPLHDLAALEDLDWELAVRRYVARINSGVGGPGCVTAARAMPGTEIETLTTLPETSPTREEEYLSESCMVVPDTSGIGAPATALSSFWTYVSCVQMTGNVYVMTLGNGRHVAIEFETYYPPDVQAVCDETGSLPSGPSGSGNVQILWRFLD